MKNNKILIFIPAYNVEKKIINLIRRIPNKIKKDKFTKLLIINDNSNDETREVTEKYIKVNSLQKKIKLINNKTNKGYGGVQKIAFNYAIKKKFSSTIMLHGDGQYLPEKLPNFVNELKKEENDAVFGSRMINPLNAINGGMPIYKFIGNKCLTFIQNILLGTNFSEFHSGYRSFKINSLKKINYRKNTNEFHFDTEIIIQFKNKSLKIKEIPIPTFYGDEISHLKSIPYGINILITTFKSIFRKL